MVMLDGEEASIPSTASLLAGPIHFGVHHSHVSGQCIIATEGLLFGAKMTPHLLLAGVVDGILVAGQIVGPGENRVARLASRWIDPFALVRASLRIAKRRVSGDQVTTRSRLAMGLALVSLKLGGGLKPQSAAMVGAGVGAAIRSGIIGSSDTLIDRQLSLRCHGARMQITRCRFQARKRGWELRSLMQETGLRAVLLEVELRLLCVGVLARESIQCRHGRTHVARTLAT